ncbi:MAG: hypothetical protein J2P15_17990 [Micromonosporaceae bacterium]|nr:hypothetical protein [Micromonosporaceae bacterium]
MRSRLLAFLGALALTVGGLLVVSAGPAAADPAHCSGWNTHPDIYNSGGISFQNGTNIRSGPYTDCTVRGDGYPSQGINVHCFVVNANGYVWFYVVDTSTGVQGWSRIDALNFSKSVTVPDCYNAASAYQVG